MRLAFVGTDSTLKSSIARTLGVDLQLPLFKGVLDKAATDKGLKNWSACDPQQIFEMLDEAVAGHAADIDKHDNGIFTLTSIEILAYYMMWCAGGSLEEQSRNVIQNCVHFAKNYDRIFLLVLKKQNYDDAKKPWTGDIMFDYSMEYMMRGIIHRFGIQHYVIDEDTLEYGKNSILEFL